MLDSLPVKLKSFAHGMVSYNYRLCLELNFSKPKGKTEL